MFAGTLAVSLSGPSAGASVSSTSLHSTTKKRTQDKSVTTVKACLKCLSNTSLCCGVCGLTTAKACTFEGAHRGFWGESEPLSGCPGGKSQLGQTTCTCVMHDAGATCAVVCQPTVAATRPAVHEKAACDLQLQCVRMQNRACM